MAFHPPWRPSPDWPTEFFYNTTTKQLYYFNNMTGAPSSSVQFVATNLQTLFNLSGTVEQKLTNVVFSGLTFATTAGLTDAADAHASNDL
jgi:hypothetical protein